MSINEHDITCRKCNQIIRLLIVLPEGLEAKPEQVQSIVRQQDDALVSDESTGSAAGNPDVATEVFDVIEKELQKKWEDHQRTKSDIDNACVWQILALRRLIMNRLNSNGGAA